MKRYKEDVLGVGEVALPGEGGALSEAAAQRQLKDSADHGSPPSTDGSTNGTHQSTKTEYVSPGVARGSPRGQRGVVFTPRSAQSLTLPSSLSVAL